jgi:hypothetical protein
MTSTSTTFAARIPHRLGAEQMEDLRLETPSCRIVSSPQMTNETFSGYLPCFFT